MPAIPVLQKKSHAASRDFHPPLEESSMIARRLPLPSKGRGCFVGNQTLRVGRRFVFCELPFCGVEPSSPDAEAQEKDLRDSLSAEETEKLDAFAECLIDADTCAKVMDCELGIGG